MSNRNLIQTVLSFCTVFLCTEGKAITNTEPSAVTSGDIETQLESIDLKLKELPHLSLRSGIGTIGYRSATYRDAERKPWVQIDFDAPYDLDEIILVPVLWRDTQKGFLDDGWPEAFTIYGGTRDDKERVLARYDQNKDTRPHIAPHIIPTQAQGISWIRIEGERLSRRHFDQLFVMQFSEVLAFSAHRNVALRGEISTYPINASDRYERAWNPQNITDGFTPYLMDAAQGEQSVAYLSPIGIGDQPEITIDLETTQNISEIHFHTVDQSDTIPQGAHPGLGLPYHLIVEGATQADFSDSREIISFSRKHFYEVGPIIMRSFAPMACRYVRIKAVNPYEMVIGSTRGTRIGFAEIDILANGESVSRGKPIATNFRYKDHYRPLKALNDGLNLYGDILPIRSWLNQLALRQQLEIQRPLLTQAIQEQYQSQKQLLRIMAWIMAVLALLSITVIMTNRLIQQRVIIRTRERIAADLHDELGANLHAIGLLTDLANASKASPNKLDNILERIRGLTERTGTAARYCSNMLESKGLYENLIEDMKRSTSRMLFDREHAFTYEGENYISNLPTNKQIDIFLFYKECLANVLRHSNATKITSHLKATAKEVILTVSENDTASTGLEVAPSLKRRAKLLGGEVQILHPVGEGPQIILHFKTRIVRIPL